MLKIWTATTSRNSKIRGVPRSVKAQMNTMIAPAKYPGSMSGNVMVRNRRKPPAPTLRADSSRLGSTLASAAAMFRYMMGYRCSASRMTTPQNPPPPNQSIGASIRPVSRRNRLIEPNRANICFIPMAPTKGGMIMGTRASPPSRPFPMKSYRTRATAMGRLMIVVRAVVTIPSSKLFSRARCWTGLCSISPKNSMENRSSV